MIGEIKPCPFCGNMKPKGFTSYADERVGYVTTMKIECGACQASMKRTSGADKNGWKTETDDSLWRRLVDAWNTRE